MIFPFSAPQGLVAKLSSSATTLALIILREPWNLVVVRFAQTDSILYSDSRLRERLCVSRASRPGDRGDDGGIVG